ncbi:MAG: IS1182 family transposase [Acetobacteraceae bacterium]|nr:IS1182 family transposase [Acetobacteraceae bacterium]
MDVIDFEAFRPTLESAYTGFGRPPLDSVFMLKLELLARQYRLSNREVIAAARFNIAYRLFLGVSLKSPLPHHTLLTYFRQRLGTERLQTVFDTLVGQARQLGLVKDRLRLKDATHILANIAVPSTIRLVAEVRDRLLDALRPFAADRAAQEEVAAECIRRETEEAADTERLVRRVTHLRAVLVWADEVPSSATFAQAPAAAQTELQAALALAHKVLADRADGAQDKVVSAQDPDARRGKHGDWYEGYLVDVAMDADSEIITAVNVLPANGDDGADTAELIRREEQAHGNDVASVSLDGVGFRGPVLRELTDPAGLALEVFTPPTTVPGFGAERFTESVIEGRRTLTCPAGESTQQRRRNEEGTGFIYRFAPSQCLGCPLRDVCLTKPEAKARTVTKNDYEAEYQAARAKAQTPEYAAVRKRHGAIERKLGELVRWHALRYARYRGRAAVLYQSLMTTFVVNLKRIVRLRDAAADEALRQAGAAGLGTT